MKASTIAALLLPLALLVSCGDADEGPSADVSANVADQTPDATAPTTPLAPTSTAPPADPIRQRSISACRYYTAPSPGGKQVESTAKVQDETLRQVKGSDIEEPMKELIRNGGRDAATTALAYNEIRDVCARYGFDPPPL